MLIMPKQILLKRKREPLELMQKERGILPPYQKQRTLEGDRYQFDRDFIRKLDRYFWQGANEFYPREQELFNALLEHAQGENQGALAEVASSLDQHLGTIEGEI